MTIDYCTIGRLSELYDFFLFDQFGVLHDGRAPFPGAVEALRRLKAAGKTIVILSNSGKRSRPNIRRLSELGFPEASYDCLLTSGEVAWRGMNDDILAGRLPASGKCLVLSRDDDMSAIDGLGLQPVSRGGEADIVVIAGSRGDEVDLRHYRALLEPAAKARVPCLCANPDMIMLSAGGLKYGAGEIARLYAGMGGEVTWIGKPHRRIYDAAREMMGFPDRGSVCCVGDSIEHDIAGGAASGFHTALVLETGIHAGATPRELSGLFGRHGARPDHFMPGLEDRADTGPPGPVPDRGGDL